MQFSSSDIGLNNTQSFPLPIDLTQCTRLFNIITEKQAYIPYTGCVLEHILHSLDLTNNEKLFYLIADSLSLINGKNATKKRYVALPATKWAEKLNCSKNEIFTMQKNLEAKGYFIVVRDKNKFGKNQRNIITVLSHLL